MRALRLVTILVLATVTSGAAQQQSKPRKAPPAEDVCANAATQAELNDCAARNLKKADAALKKVYAALLKDLDEDHAPILQKAQKAWEKYRDAECVLQSSRSLGGSAQAQLYADCMAAMAVERATALKDARKTLSDFVAR